MGDACWGARNGEAGVELICPGVVAPPPKVKLGAVVDVGADDEAGAPNVNPPVGGGPEGVSEPEAGLLDPNVKEELGAKLKPVGAGVDELAAGWEDGVAPKVKDAGVPDAVGAVLEAGAPNVNLAVD